MRKKTNDIYVKTPNILFLVKIWLAYSIINTKNKMFKNPVFSCFSIYGEVLSFKKSNKSTAQLQRKRVTDWHTDMRTDESNEIDFICIHSAMPGVQLTNFSHCISLQSSSSYMFEVVLIMSVNFERLRPCGVNIIIYRLRKNKQNCLRKSLICWLLISVKKIFGYCNKLFLIQNHRVTED